MSDINGIITYKVPVGGKTLEEAESDIKDMMNKFKSYDVKPYNDKPIEKDFWLPSK